jgi:hypothetical protein
MLAKRPALLLRPRICADAQASLVRTSAERRRRVPTLESLADIGEEVADLRAVEDAMVE